MAKAKFKTVIEPDGTKKWYINGLCHRDDGPAIIYPNGSEEWYKNGKLHRLYGSARTIWTKTGVIDGGWYIDGRQLSEKEVTAIIKAQRIRGIKIKLRAVNAFKRGATAAPGTMEWAYAMGHFHSKYPQREFSDGFDTAYTREQLSFMAQGMGLNVSCKMTKLELTAMVRAQAPATA